MCLRYIRVGSREKKRSKKSCTSPNKRWDLWIGMTRVRSRDAECVSYIRQSFSLGCLYCWDKLCPTGDVTRFSCRFLRLACFSSCYVISGSTGTTTNCSGSHPNMETWACFTSLPITSGGTFLVCPSFLILFKTHHHHRNLLFKWMTSMMCRFYSSYHQLYRPDISLYNK